MICCLIFAFAKITLSVVEGLLRLLQGFVFVFTLRLAPQDIYLPASIPTPSSAKASDGQERPSKGGAT